MQKKRKSGKAREQLVFFFDVDNTLLNNDRVLGDVRRYLKREVGGQRAGRYWKIFDRLREECQYADYLGALQRYREQYPHDTHLLKVSHFLIGYPFAQRLYDDSLEVIRRARRWGMV